MNSWVRKKRTKIVLVVLILLGVYRFLVYPQYVVPILMYHYVNTDIGTLSVKPENFDKQMKYLRDRKYNVISLDEFVQGKKDARKFPHNTVVITFDDGGGDNYVNAFPILRKYNIPATIFIITQFMGKGSFLTWEQVQEMAVHQIDFGSHTQHHVYLPDASAETIRQEALGSKSDIEQHLGKPANHFCYPVGGFTQQVKGIIESVGYLSAVTTNRGYDRTNNDLYELMRVKATNSDALKPFHFWAKLSGYYNFFRSSKRGY